MTAPGFNPRPPRGGRHLGAQTDNSVYVFQSTPPAWGATRSGRSIWGCARGFNPRPPRGGRRPGRVVDVAADVVSIHAPRVGGDKAPGFLHLTH